MDAKWQSFPAREEAYEEIRAALMAAAKAAGLTGARLLRLELGFEEAALNIIRHAYEAGGELWLRAYGEGGAFVIELRDFGRAFDPTQVEEKPIAKGASAEAQPVGGLGILLMKKTFPRMSYERRAWQGREANCLRLEL